MVIFSHKLKKMAAANQLDDTTRIQKLLDELKQSKQDGGGGGGGGGGTTTGNARSGQPSKALDMEASARTLLMEYVNEITCAILEEAACVATHRNSTEIDANDVNLVLVKKFGIEVPGMTRIKSLHKHAYKSNWPTISAGTSLHDAVNKVQAQNKEAEEQKQSGTKRKLEDTETATPDEESDAEE
jgi:transcription initiation factor TFIID subunit TAF12